MDIMVILCKGLHVLALASITVIFLFRLHGKSQNRAKVYSTQHHHNSVAASNMTVSLKKGNIK